MSRIREAASRFGKGITISRYRRTARRPAGSCDCGRWPEPAGCRAQQLAFSGLDVDALRDVAAAINNYVATAGDEPGKPAPSMLMITHYRRLLEYITPTYVHIMLDGRVVESGGAELAEVLEKEGYEHWSVAA